MSKGAYLRENRNPKEEHTRRLTDEERKANGEKRRRRKRQQRRMMLSAGLLLVAVVFVILLAMNSNPLIGRWCMDEVTAYEFGRNGKGSMILPFAEYEFSYKIKDDTLYIDFVQEEAKDAEYTFRVEGDTLILNGGNATTKGEYLLTQSGQ